MGMTTTETRCYICGVVAHTHPTDLGHPFQFAPSYGVPEVFDTYRKQPTEAELDAWTHDDAAALLAQQQWEQAAIYLAEDQSIRAAQTLVQAVGDNKRTDDLLAFGMMCVAAHRRLTLT